MSIESYVLAMPKVELHVHLDITPTSNIQLGVYPDYASHPLPQLYGAGAIVTISSDDPPLFNTTLSDEYALLATRFGLDINAIDQVVLNSIRSSFLPEMQRRDLETTCQAELARLKALLLYQQSDICEL